MRYVADKSRKENQNPHFRLRNFSFSKILPFVRYVGKYSKDGEATDDNMEQAHFMLHT